MERARRRVTCRGNGMGKNRQEQAILRRAIRCLSSHRLDRHGFVFGRDVLFRLN